MTELEYKKANAKIKKMAKIKDKLNPRQLEAAVKLICEVQEYERTKLETK